MIYLEFIFHLSLLVALSVVSSFIEKRWDRNTRMGVLLQGFLFGGSAVVGMLRPLILEPGLIFDGRSIMVSLCALFFGPWAMLTAGAITIACRIGLGGEGMFTGSLVILSSAGIGLLERNHLKPETKPPSAWRLYQFGLAVHLAMLALMFTLPDGTGLIVVKRIGLPVILLYPLATILSGKILSDQVETERIMAALRASEARLQLANKATNDVVWDWDIEKEAQLWNEAGTIVFGWTDIVEQPQTIAWWLERIHPEDRQRVGDGFFDVLKNPAMNYWHDEYRFQKADGSFAHVMDRSYVLRDEKGKAVRVIGAKLDITERKRAEEMLRETDRKLRLIAENTTDVIFAYDMNRRLIYVNPAVEKLTGYSVAELRERNFINWLHPEDEARIMQLWEEIFMGKKILINEFRIVTKEGQIKWCMNSWNPLVDENGQQIGIQGLGRDITERKLAEEEREKLQALLLQAQKMEAIGQLAGGIAHDFNNILGAIFGYTQLALSNIQEGEKETRYFLEMSLNSAVRAKNLVKQILTFSRKSEVEKQPVLLPSLMKEVLKMLRASLPATIEIRQNLPEELLTVLGDFTQLHQVLMNLCTNAAHAMREKGGVLEVSLSEETLVTEPVYHDLDLAPGRYACMTVSDTGGGIDPGIRERIFDPFFTTKDKSEGTGLGLSVAMGIIKNHKGWITFDSTVGQGTRFHVYLPKIESETESEIHSFSIPQGKGERILLVDDEIDLLQVGEKMLNSIGYQVNTQTSSLEALAVFHATPDQFDLIITDLTMPKMTGLQLAEEILHIRPDIPVLLHTGYSEKIIQEKIQSVGIRRTILKPYDLMEIARILRDVLDNPASS